MLGLLFQPLKLPVLKLNKVMCHPYCIFVSSRVEISFELQSMHFVHCQANYEACFLSKVGFVFAAYILYTNDSSIA